MSLRIIFPVAYFCDKAHVYIIHFSDLFLFFILLFVFFELLGYNNFYYDMYGGKAI